MYSKVLEVPEDVLGFVAGAPFHLLTHRIDPSINAAPDNILAIKLSCPGESTKLTTLISSLGPPQLGKSAAWNSKVEMGSSDIYKMLRQHNLL